MYMKGLSAGWDSGDIGSEQWPISYPSSYPAPASNQTPTATTDWTGLIGTAIQTFGTYQTAKTNAESAAAIETARARYYPQGYTLNPAAGGGYMVAPGAGFGGFSTQTLILLALFGVGAYLILKN